MECNKEEAIRAKVIAEMKMQNKDFIGARKIALRAQQLYPEIDNISQMLSVCDVHCSAAEHRIFGTADWYAILQIDPSADEALIKKQYRRFALLLHPDKNKFPGAGSAFQLIGEAQRVLSDKESRSSFDIKCRASVKLASQTQVMQQTNKITDTRKSVLKQTASVNHKHQRPRQQTETTNPCGSQTFWTICPFCSVKFQYYVDVLNRALRCQTCSKPFIAADISLQGTPATNFSQPAPHQRKSNGPIDPAAVQGGIKDSWPSNGSMNTDSRKSERVDVKVNSAGDDKITPPGKINCERKRKRESESNDGSRKETVFGGVSKTSGGYTDGFSGKQSPGRSHRGGEEFIGSPSKRGKGSVFSRSPDKENRGASMKNNTGISSAATEDVKVPEQKGNASRKGSLSNGNDEVKKTKAGKTRGNGIKKYFKPVNDSESNVKSRGVSDPEFFVFPDTDFSNFDKKEGCFKVGQVWACYDNWDAMPRFYARIKQVYSSGFKLRITWLEPDPDDEDEIRWANEDLPVTCGKFLQGSSEVTKDPLMFSHLICWEKGSKRDSFKIYPRAGETWALFMNWEIDWNLDLNSKRKFEYEFVEILADYVDGRGIAVARLGKVKGFACLFCRTVKGEVDSFEVPPSQLLRFSHRVPSFKLSGKEREDVPRWSFELDPAALGGSLEEIDVPENVTAGPDKMHDSDGSCDKNPVGVNSDSDTEDPSPEMYEIPDSEFHDFDTDKSSEKIQVGEIWALYSDDDGFPKYYGQIKKTSSDPDFKVHITWLAPSPLPKDMIRWRHRKMPICSGRFKKRRGKPQVYEGTTSFSHRMRADRTKEQDQFMIIPREGEIWAVYKQWDVGMKPSDLCCCEYDVVEVIEGSEFSWKVSVLERVEGFNSVFKARGSDELQEILVVPGAEMLRFSHYVPAFKLTEERNGSLRGCWELDPASLPTGYFGSR